MNFFIILMLSAGAAFLLYCFAVLIHRIEECPRMIMGYNCKGKTCDHSKATLHQSKSAMHHNHKQ